MSSTDHEAPPYEVFSIPLLPCSSYSQIPSSEDYVSIPIACSSFSVRDQVSHPYTTTGTILLLHILIFVFLKGEREDKKILYRTVEGIPGVPSALNFSVSPVPSLT